MGTGIVQTARMKKPAPRRVSAGPARSCGTCLCRVDLSGYALGTEWPGSVPPAFRDPVLCGPDCFAPPEQGDPGHSELEGLLSSKHLLIFLHEKASDSAFHPGCGWATFASFSTGNYSGNDGGSVCACVLDSHWRA